MPASVSAARIESIATKKRLVEARQLRARRDHKGKGHGTYGQAVSRPGLHKIPNGDNCGLIFCC